MVAYLGGFGVRPIRRMYGIVDYMIIANFNNWWRDTQSPYVVLILTQQNGYDVSIL